MTRPPPGPPVLLELDVGPVAHGGHCVARLPAGGDAPGKASGRVVFVRHALPGERVRAVVTEGGDPAGTEAYWRADAVEVLRASPDRVTPPCPWAGASLTAARCGGCDWQHAAPAAQRALKAAVVVEQLQRLAGLDVEVVVEPVGSGGADPDGARAEGLDAELAAGLGWRTRVQHAVGPGGRAGLRAHRSHTVVPVDWCRIAHPRVREVEVTTAARWPGVASVEVVAPAAGDDRLVVLEPVGGRRVRVPSLPGAPSVAVAGREGTTRVSGRTWVAETVHLPGGPRTFRVTGSGFWQVHPGAAAALSRAVLDAAAPAAGERAVDLYAGVGLFSAALAQAVGAGGRVVSVESDGRAASDARRNLRDLPQVRIVPGRVERVLAAGAGGGLVEELDGGRADVVVLDPPRTGARRAVVERVVALAPRVVVHVACDPAALARDVATFAERGYVLDGLRAFDLFPQTHHVECVARLVPAPR